jgi:hypothetical protein
MQEGVYLFAHPNTTLLLLALNGIDTITPKELMDTRYHLEMYKQSYSARVPAMTVTGKLSADETFAPPDYKSSGG